VNIDLPLLAWCRYRRMDYLSITTIMY